MSKPKMPLDAWDNPIPAIGLKGDNSHQISAVAASSKNATPFDAKTRIVSVYATTPVYLLFGDSNVDVAGKGHFFPDGLYYDFCINADEQDIKTHLSVRRADTSDGVVYVSEKE